MNFESYYSYKDATGLYLKQREITSGTIDVLLRLWYYEILASISDFAVLREGPFIDIGSNIVASRQGIIENIVSLKLSECLSYLSREKFKDRTDRAVNNRRVGTALGLGVILLNTDLDNELIDTFIETHKDGAFSGGFMEGDLFKRKSLIARIKPYDINDDQRFNDALGAISSNSDTLFPGDVPAEIAGREATISSMGLATASIIKLSNTIQ